MEKDFGASVPQIAEQPIPVISEDELPQEKPCKFNIELLEDIKEDIAGLRDLFVRRLNEDKQKTELIKTLNNCATFAVVEPFLADIILLLDRLEKKDDDFVRSVAEELYEIINRRGVTKIKVTSQFNPSLYKAVRVTEDENISELCVTHIVRNGYVFDEKVLRPAEVVVAKPMTKR